MIEISIKISDEERTLTQKFLIFEDGFILSKQNPDLMQMVENTVAIFKGTADDVVIRIKYQWD